jgi:hypothetical protein
MRNRSEPSQVHQAGFESDGIAVAQEAHGCYCAPARGARLWRFGYQPFRPAKTAERRTNRACATGRSRRLGRPREKLPKAGDAKNGTAGLRAQGNLREKRPDPWLRANAPPKAAADPELKGPDANQDRRRVCTRFADRWRNHQSKRAEKPHSKFSVARRWTALLRGRKLRLPWRMASGSWQPP